MKLLLTIAILMLSACSTMQAYTGPTRDASEVALIKGAIAWNVEVKIEKVDGVSPGIFQDRVSVLPGKHLLHTLTMFRSRSDKMVVFRSHIRFEAKAGQEYMLFSDYFLYGPRLWMIDSDGELVALHETRPPGRKRRR